MISAFFEKITCIIDFNGKIMGINKTGQMLLGYTPEKITELTIYDLLPKLRCAENKGLFFLLTNEYSEKEWQLKKGDDTYLTVEIAIKQLKDDRLLILLKDIYDQNKKRIDYLTKLEEIVSEISTRLVQSLTDKIDEEINAGLRSIGELVNLDRSYIFLLDGENGVVNNTHEWCAEGIEPQIKNLQGIPTAAIPWWMEKLNNFQHIYIPFIGELPPEANNEKKILEAQSILSVLVIPMVSNQKLIGFIGFDAVRTRLLWSDQHFSLLRIIGQIFANALERKRAEIAMGESQDRYRAFLANTSVGVSITDLNGHILEANNALSDFLGYTNDELVGVHFSQFTYEYDLELDTQLFNSLINGERESYVLDKRYVRKDDGRIVWGRLNATLILDKNQKPNFLSIIVEDITERKMLEAELQNANKLESIGLLAGGIAHDFNNILAIILGNISLANVYKKRDIIDLEKIFVTLGNIEKAVMQAKQLTQQLFVFAKGGEPVKRTVKIDNLLRDIANFALSGSNVKNQIAIEEGLKPLYIDDGQISQVLNNIIINGMQAMPKGGTIYIETRNVLITSDSHKSLPLKNGEYVEISVRDEGIGIPEELLQKIFDPFYTTKDEGSGLGLTISYSIVKKHHGYINVQSQRGKGSIFNIYLPVSLEVLEEEKRAEKIYYGTGRILVMDDEVAIHAVLDEMLRVLGYDVACVYDGNEALKAYQEALFMEEPFDLVIMDLTIPGGMGGKDTIVKLLDLDPDAKVIVSSGYYHNPIMANYQDYGFKAAVPKPYKLQTLSKVLHMIAKSKAKEI